MKSLPVWECGLKSCMGWNRGYSRRHSPCGSVDWNRDMGRTADTGICHSPCGSVDWNIIRIIHRISHRTSLPVWECGLKSWYASIACCSQTSLPVWECGLKFTIGQEQPTVLASLPVWECGLKYGCYAALKEYIGHSPCGSVDWNRKDSSLDFGKGGHSPCGSVDWNMPPCKGGKGKGVTPRVGVWIEIRMKYPMQRSTYSHSPCGSVDWNEKWRNSVRIGIRHSPCGSVDWNLLPLYISVVFPLSLPVWECGLKYRYADDVWHVPAMSLPVQECGLK